VTKPTSTDSNDLVQQAAKDEPFKAPLELEPVKATNKRRVNAKLFKQVADLRTVFEEESREVVEENKRRGHLPLDLEKRSKPWKDVELAINEEYIDIPKRPPWTYETAATELRQREHEAFNRWLEHVRSFAQEGRQLNYFELNLEVWRQLWRVVERSNIILLVVDARYPLFHFPISLYKYVIEDHKKPLLMVLNKCDLVSKENVQAWKDYFNKRFPQLEIATFNSFSNYMTEEQAVQTDINKKRKYRKGRKRYEEARGQSSFISVDPWKFNSRLAGVQELLSKVQDIVQRNPCFVPSSSANLPPELEDEEENERSSEQQSSRSKGNKGQRNRKIHAKADDKAETNEDEKEQELSTPLGMGRKRLNRKKKKQREDAEAWAEKLEAKRKRQGADVPQLPPVEPDLNSSGHYDDDYDTEDTDEGSELEENPFDDADKIMLGTVGHPNVGKSSMINALMKRKVASTSRTPGHTKHFQTLVLNDKFALCDCPGLVFPAFDRPKPLQILCGLYPIAQVREPFSAIRFLAERIPLEKVYNLDMPPSRDHGEAEEWSPYLICEALALRRGYFNSRSGRPDVHRAGLEILKDCVDGNLVLSWPPPPLPDPHCSTSTQSEESTGRCERVASVTND